MLTPFSLLNSCQRITLCFKTIIFICVFPMASYNLTRNHELRKLGTRSSTNNCTVTIINLYTCIIYINLSTEYYVSSYICLILKLSLRISFILIHSLFSWYIATTFRKQSLTPQYPKDSIIQAYLLYTLYKSTKTIMTIMIITFIHISIMC